jgi:ferredoxin/predicted GNAT family acetyltransferase
MRVLVDRDRCVGSGTCEALAPDVFEVDDDGVLVVLREEPADGEEPDVRDAVTACPTRALSLDGSAGIPAPSQEFSVVMEPTVRDAPEEQRYEIRDGERVLGLAAYERRGDTVVFTHTEVDPDAGQSGLGSTLVRAALDDVRSAGGSVVPRCSFVRGWIERHPEYGDLVVRSEQ